MGKTPFVCSNYKPEFNVTLFKIYYILAIIGLIITEVMLNIKEEKIVIDDKIKFKKEDGFNFLLFIVVIFISFFLCSVLPKLFKYMNINEGLFVFYFWMFTHVLLYYILTLILPNHWPIILAIGILWEYFECYSICHKSFGCNGLPDILCNSVGILGGILTNILLEKSIGCKSKN